MKKRYTLKAHTPREELNPLSKKSKIIWAVDPTQDPADAKNLITELKSWAKRLDCDVQPVSIFSKSVLNFPVELAFPWKEKLEEIAQISVNNYLKGTNTKSFLPPELVFVNGLSSRKMATEMARYAENKKALLVFANTRAKKTWSPIRLGGFAETLVATSRIPVLLLNPSALPSTNIPSILFPTDFSRESKNALMRLAPWAKAFKSKIILYNQLETPNIYSGEANGMWPALGINSESMIKDIEKVRMKKANTWSDFLHDENINSTVLVQRQRKYIGVEINEVARRNKVHLITLANRSGPVAQTILGGVARDVLLQAKCPVLIFYRPKAIRKHRLQSKPPVTSMAVI